MNTELASSGLAAPHPARHARSDIRQRLRSATHGLHIRLDHHPLLAGITQARYPLSSYGQVLLGYFHLYAWLEAGITAAIQGVPIDFDYQERLKLPWLRADLDFLGLDPLAAAHLPVHATSPLAIRNAAQLAGTLYAIEGATLGGQVIARQVGKNRGFTSHTGARFFNGYGAETAQRWNAFEAFMQRSCGDESSQQQACAAAIASFLAVEATLDASHAKVQPAGEAP